MSAPQITPLPTPPSRQDPASFSSRADAFLGALPTFATEANALATEANNDATAANASATAAANSASAAAASATNAANQVTLAADQVALAAGQVTLATTQANNAAASATAAANTLDAFDDRYLGAKASDPTLDNDGNPLITGALYWSTSQNAMRVFNGTGWQTAAGSVQGDFGIVRTVITATAGQTVFTVPAYNVGTNSIMVYLNGSRLLNSDYTETNTTTITLASPAAAGDELLFEIGIVTTGSVTSAALTTFAPTGNITATNVQAAIAELDGEKASLTGTETLTNKTLTDPRLTLGGTNGVAGQVPVSQGAGLPPMWGSVSSVSGLNSVQIFTSSGTWTKPSGLKRIRVTVVGGGASGAGSNVSSFPAAGGGGGGFSIKIIEAASLGATETVTVGAGGAGVINSVGNGGGTSSFGSHCSATGGSTAPSVNSVSAGGGAGGVGTGGDINGEGGGGGGSASTSPAFKLGFGGSSLFCGSAPASTTTTGVSAGGPGGGGSGTSGGNGTSTGKGGDGANGIVIVEEIF